MQHAVVWWPHTASSFHLRDLLRSELLASCGSSYESKLKIRPTHACYISFERKLNVLSNDMQHAVVWWPHTASSFHLRDLLRSELLASCGSSYESKLKIGPTHACYISFERKLNVLSNDMQHTAVVW